MYIIKAYSVKDGEKELVSKEITSIATDIEVIMRRMAADIVSDINNGKFDDIPEDFDVNISPEIGDYYNRYRFIGVPSSRYFYIMCYIFENDMVSHDTIMFRGCKIHVDSKCVITIGDHKIFPHNQYASFYDIFCRVDEQFESTNSIIDTDNPYRAVLMKFDFGNHVTFEKASYVSHDADVGGFINEYLANIRDKEFPRSKVMAQPPLNYDFVPKAYGYITTNNQKHEYKLECVPVYTVTDKKKTIIYKNHPIISDGDRYIVTCNYEVELGRFDSIDDAYSFIDRKEADYLNNYCDT